MYLIITSCNRSCFYFCRVYISRTKWARRTPMHPSDHSLPTSSSWVCFSWFYMYSQYSFCCCRWEKGGSQSCESWRQDRRHRQGCCLFCCFFNFTFVLQKMGKMWQELDEKAKVDCFFFMCKPFTAAGPLWEEGWSRQEEVRWGDGRLRRLNN